MNDIIIGNHVSPRADQYPDALCSVVSAKAANVAWKTIRTFPGYTFSPLRNLHQTADSLGVHCIEYKDESHRLGLNSFKALGAPYAFILIAQAFLKKTGVANEGVAESILDGSFSRLLSGLSVATATDGNHGLALAWAASRSGGNCRIYLHAGVSQERAGKIRRFGAEIVWVDGNYDDSVVRCQEDAAALGHQVISDTSYAGYETIPSQVMNGYAVLCLEAFEQLHQVPTHIFVQAGVGALAAAVFASFWEHFGADCPRLIVVEPEQAACLYQSRRAGHRVLVPGEHATNMDGLACGETSAMAWRIVSAAADGFMLISDEQANAAIEVLQRDRSSSSPISVGPSGAAGFAGLMQAVKSASSRQAFGLSASSRIFLIGSEANPLFE